MKKRWSEKITDYLIVNETVLEEDRELYEFGIRETIAILQNLLCTVFIALLFGKIVETIYFLCAFIILRSFAGGFHASSELKCFICSIFLIVLVEHIFVLVSINKILMFCWIIANYIIISYAPIESKNKPISISERVNYRYRVRCILLVEAIVVFVQTIAVSIKMAIIISVIAEAILILLTKK